MNKLTIMASLALLISATACHEKQPEKAEVKKFALSDSMEKMIALDSVSNSFIATETSLSGEVSFNENNVIKVFPRGSGQVIESKVTLGDKVKEGQVLAVIKSADIAGNYADLASANADIAIAQREFDNTRSLYKGGIASERELNEAKQNLAKAKAAKNKIESVLSINGGQNTTSNGTYVLTSPIDGYIVEKKVNTGNFIRSDMGDYLFTISDLKNVWINANVFEDDIAKVKEGYDVEVYTLAYPDKTFVGKIDKLSEVLDPTNKTMKVRVKLENKEGLLKPSMFAKVIVSNEEKVKALCVPTKALISQDGKNFVVVYKGRDNMKIAEVSIQKIIGDKTFISGGVQEGDKLIVSNQLLIFQQLLDTP